MMMRAVLLILLLIALPTVGCGNVELQSRQKDRDIIIDGGPRDWDGALEPVEDAGFSFGLMNDHEHLYIALVIADQAKQRQIMMGGLILWFDETAKREKHFALKFPIGMVENGMNPMDMTRDKNPAALRETCLKGLNEFLIAASEGSWQMNAVGSLENISIAAGFEGSVMVLEYKVPLAQRGPYGYGVGAGAGSAISLCVESPEIDIVRMRQGMPGRPGGMGGGSGGRGGGPPGIGVGRGGMGNRGGMGGPGGMGGGRSERPEAFKQWMTVTLHEG
jgi:hypothetical protein